MKAKMLTLVLAAVGSLAGARPVALDVSLSNPLLVAGETRRTYLKISLTGLASADRTDRAPANVAIVLDRSGSMSGEKIARAKEAAMMAVGMLEPRDVVSVIAYSDFVSVLVPATKVSDAERITRTIGRIQADGSTALFAGVSKGAAEVRKFLEKNRVNRVILLSDGLANVGPDTPGALGDLGASLKREGISVTTIGLGLGYNEDLMARLARESDGNHAFVENSQDLVRIFGYEFRDILSVVAREVTIEIECRGGARPIRGVNREADVVGSRAYASINELYGGQEKYLLLEVEIPAGDAGERRSVAAVSVSYADTAARSVDRLESGAAVTFTESRAAAEEKLDRAVMKAVVIQQATDASERAVELRDQGRIEDARKLLLENAELLRASAGPLAAPELMGLGAANQADAEALEEDWDAQRKEMRSRQHADRVQQAY